MSHQHSSEAVDRLLCRVLQTTLPFGGIAVLLVGDFRHILPVVRAASRAKIVAACFQISHLFRLSSA